MRGRRFLRVLKVVAIVIVAFTVFGFVVTHLWNYLMPGLFGLRMITFWQAVGLMVLGRLLFGGFRPGRAPAEVLAAERITAIDPTSRAIWLKKFSAEESRRVAPVVPRRWRPQGW